LALRIPWFEDEAEAVPVMPRRAAARARERTFMFTEQYTDSRNEGVTNLEKEIKNER
jgi:hypothetical protein